MYSKLIQYIEDWLLNTDLSEKNATLFKALIIVAVIIALAVLADFIASRVILTFVKRLIRKTKTRWDDILLNKKVLNRIAHIAPAIVIYYMVGYALEDYSKWLSFVQSGTYIYIVLMILLAVLSLINGLHEIYTTLDLAKNRSIKSYIQVVKIIISFIGIIIILSIILGRTPDKLLAGLGALAAVLMLVFKDSILGLVGGIQLSANNMVRLGDWISMPSRNADGDVIDISLNTVKVQNWDKTISTIPTYSLITESFSNWRGMEESGGRRIKRAINIDMQSIKFCDAKMITKFKKIKLLSAYIDTKQEELKRFNEENQIDDSVLVNGRRMTNIGTFRRYIEEYLKNHPKIHKEMTFLVRQLPPNEKGLPLEIYVFSNEQRWAHYEGIQSDIFDHLMAVIPEFELRVFQNPTGLDFQKM